MEVDAKKRFSEHAKYYAKYRPRYPDALLTYFERELSFSQTSIVADVGSGTGILSEMFLRNGNLVFGIEPNGEMRKIAEANLSTHSGFKSIDGSAESTTLPSNSVDFITAAQSFHWFNGPKARAEFRRILRKGGWVVLLWNTRKISTQFLQNYDQLVRGLAAERGRVGRESLTDEEISSFLGPHRTTIFPNFQDLDYEGLAGRLLSSSYAPLLGEPGHEQILARLREMFDRCESGGAVRFEYDTEVYAGQLSQART